VPEANRFTIADAATSAWVVIAPIDRPLRAALLLDALQLGDTAEVDDVPGFARRCFIAPTRL
jgi:hypothetical protein